jgi:GNAT superfamily N-acetyltransferase
MVLRLSPEDLPVIVGFQPDGWAAIGPAFEFYLKEPCCYPVKAVSGKKPVGIGAAISLGETAWLAHIIVSKEERKKGVGSLIVSELLSWCREKECRTVFLIATDIGYPLYRKFGFRDQTRYLFLEKSGPEGLPDPDGTVSRIAPRDHKAILELDRVVSGEDRRMLLAGHLETGWAVRREKRLSGFFLPTLGEGLAVAADPDSGRSLLSLRCRDSAKATLPQENGAGVDFLNAIGYRETKCAWRMVLGPERSWRPDLLYSRIGGNVG